LRAFRHFDGFRGTTIKPWLLAILRNVCRSEYARRAQFVDADAGYALTGFAFGTALSAAAAATVVVGVFRSDQDQRIVDDVISAHLRSLCGEHLACANRSSSPSLVRSNTPEASANSCYAASKRSEESGQ
jgi:hypothetical protein